MCACARQLETARCRFVTHAWLIGVLVAGVVVSSKWPQVPSRPEYARFVPLCMLALAGLGSVYRQACGLYVLRDRVVWLPWAGRPWGIPRSAVSGIQITTNGIRLEAGSDQRQLGPLAEVGRLLLHVGMSWLINRPSCGELRQLSAHLAAPRITTGLAAGPRQSVVVAAPTQLLAALAVGSAIATGGMELWLMPVFLGLFLGVGVLSWIAGRRTWRLSASDQALRVHYNWVAMGYQEDQELPWDTILGVQQTQAGALVVTTLGDLELPAARMAGA